MDKSFRSLKEAPTWQGGIDFLATFSPGVLEGYPSTLLAAVTAAPGRLLGSSLDRDRYLAAVAKAIEQIAYGVRTHPEARG